MLQTVPKQLFQGATTFLAPALDLRFAIDKSLTPAVGAATLTHVRSSNARYFDSSGVSQNAANDEARFEHDAIALTSHGLLIEDQRTNGLRNNTMSGAAAGTPGTLPTHWSSSIGALTREIVGTGTENGIDYIDIRYHGTTSTITSTIVFETATGIAAAVSEAWTESVFLKLAAGSFTNISSTNIIMQAINSGGSQVSLTGASSAALAIDGTLRRFAHSTTTSDAATAFIRFRVQFNHSSGVAIDVTLRVGLPQLALAPFVSSVIRTTGSAATRNADTISTSTTGVSSDRGTVLVEARTAPGAGTQHLWSLNDGTADERIYIQRNSSNEIHAIVVDGGVVQADLNLGTVAANTDFKVAFAWQDNSIAGCLNGGTVVTDAGASLPTITTQNWGHDYAGANQWNSTIARTRNFARRLPDSVLQRMST